MSTKSMIRQSSFPVSGESLIPRPIYMTKVKEGPLDVWGQRTICTMMFRDRVGRATIMQSMPGMSVPSVKIAKWCQGVRFAPAVGGMGTNRSLQEPGIPPP